MIPPYPVLLLLRRPDQENAYVHEDCLQRECANLDDLLILRIIQMMEQQASEHCYLCGGSIMETPQRIGQEEPTQLFLFDAQEHEAQI